MRWGWGQLAAEVRSGGVWSGAGQEVSDGGWDEARLGSAPLRGGFCGQEFAPVVAGSVAESPGAAGGELQDVEGDGGLDLSLLSVLRQRSRWPGGKVVA